MVKSLAFSQPLEAGSESDEEGTTEDDMDKKKQKNPTLSFHAVLRRSFEECHTDSYSTTRHNSLRIGFLNEDTKRRKTKQNKPLRD